MLEEIGKHMTRFCGSGSVDLKGAEPVRPFREARYLHVHWYLRYM